MRQVVFYLVLLGALIAWAARAAAPPEDTTIQFARPAVDAAFSRGAPLLENADYKIHASRRTEAGRAELHALDTDLIYVLEGSATLVTGGVVQDPVEVAPDEIRGNVIEGGTEREISPGEVIVVQSGTPHWFKDVRGPVLYYVVKVTARKDR